MSIDSIVLLVIALINLVTGYLSYRAHQAILVVEKATNSMKDALVASTAKASYAAGREATTLQKAGDLAEVTAQAARVLATVAPDVTLGRRDTIEPRNTWIKPGVQTTT